MVRNLLAAAILLVTVEQATPPSSMQTSRLTVQGGEIVYDVAGPAAAAPVVFLHGSFMDRHTWDRQSPAFSRQFRVVRYDIRPFGESSRPEKAYSAPEDLLQLLDHLKIARAHLVGHSFGGSVALDFALLHPDRVASLVLASSGASGVVLPEDERKAAAAVFAAIKDGDEAILKAWIDHPIWAVSRTRADVVRDLEATTRRSLPAFRMSFAPFVPLKPPAIDRLGEIKAPTLVLVGDRDTPGNRHASDLLAKQIPGASLRIIAGADHGVPLGWPEEFNRAVADFIATARR